MSTKKDIKDFIHLYIGVDTTHGTLIGVDGGICNIRFKCGTKSVEFLDRLKPILRPLSDMTEEEAICLIKTQTPEYRYSSIEVFEIKGNHLWYIDGEMWHGDGVSEMYDKYIKFNELSPEQFHYLLSKGFDLFGLIESGLAIDKTKM